MTVDSEALPPASATKSVDYSVRLLSELYATTELHANSRRRVWVADESDSARDFPPGFRFDDPTLIVTNRIDVYRSHIQQERHVELSDFSFDQVAEGEVDAIYYRVSKEKAVVHHVINCSARLLREGGSLYLTGEKGDGTKTYFEKAKQLLGARRATWKKAKHGVYCGHLTRSTTEPVAPLDTQDYPELRPIADLEGIRFDSKPGIFGWNKIDQGSALLIEQLPRFIEQGQPPTTLLDLGCGYGYLAVMAGRQLEIAITATDNNAAATAACERNMQINGIRGQVLLDDCGSDIDTRFDLILCNPPFHRGFSTHSELTQRFLENTQRLLAPGGAALFVVSRFIPLETMAVPYFTQVERCGADGSFKIVSLRH